MKDFLLGFLISFEIFAFCYGSGGAVGGSIEKSAQGNTGSSEKTKVIRIGSDLDLHCNIGKEASTGDNFEVKWFKDDVPVVIEEDQYKLTNNVNLTIVEASKDDVGVFKCETVNYTPTKMIEINVVYLKYKDMLKSTMVLEGDKLNLTCDVEGDPSPFILWTKDDVKVEDAVNASHYSLETNYKGVENASFIVESAAYSDRARYHCFIKTGDVEYNTTIFVRVKDMYAALWPFLGICAEVFVLCLIIFIYEKRRAKADFEESDTDQPPEQKTTSDHNKDSVRQRK